MSAVCLDMRNLLAMLQTPATPQSGIFIVGFVQATQSYFLKWIDFSSRSPRSEYWWGTLGATLIALIVSIPIGVVVGIVSIGMDFDAETAANFVTVPIQIFFTIAGIALGVRRLHDLNKSGWWMLLYLTIVGALVVIYWCCVKGEENENRFGPDPLAAPDTPTNT
jgi:uncharacterized membrane protein YhaH (DUF805 family)